MALVVVLACSDPQERNLSGDAGAASTVESGDAGASPPTSSDAGAGDAGVAASEPACPDGDYRCNGAQLMTCEPGVGWRQVDTCVTEELCADTATQCRVAPEVCVGELSCLPPACEVEDTVCAGSLFERCNAGRTGLEVVADCGAACDGERCDASLGCQPEPCFIGDALCEMDNLQVCAADCTAFVPVPEEEAEALRLFCGH